MPMSGPTKTLLRVRAFASLVADFQQCVCCKATSAFCKVPRELAEDALPVLAEGQPVDLEAGKPGGSVPIDTPAPLGRHPHQYTRPLPGERRAQMHVGVAHADVLVDERDRS